MHVNISLDVIEYLAQFATSLPVPYLTAQLKHTNTEYFTESVCRRLFRVLN